jgi:exonuclease III
MDILHPYMQKKIVTQNISHDPCLDNFKNPKKSLMSKSNIEPNISSSYNKDTLIIVHWNANSLNKKQDEFKMFIFSQNIDICIVTETKIGKNTAIDLSGFFESYNILKYYRKNEAGAGGIFMFFKKDLNYFEINDFKKYNIEQIAIKLLFNNKLYLIIGLYNPPNKLLPKEFFYRLSNEYENFLIVSDLNSKTTSIGCKSKNKSGIILE